MELPNYRKRLPNARRLRRDSTDAERALWDRLRGRRLEGHKFRRQVPVGPYIVDFFCHDAGLVIEVDGGQHDADRAKDDVRTRYLERHGLRVIRFWNNDVLQNLDGVFEIILSELGRRDRSTAPPRP